MDIVPSGVSTVDLRSSVEALVLEQIPDGSGSSHFDGPEGWIRGLSTVRLNVHALPYALRQALANLLTASGRALGPLAQVMVNKLAAGESLSAHRDGLPDRARFHLPVITHPWVRWWDEVDGHVHMMEGSWYGPVRYCGVLHSMTNPSTVDRVHVVADFEWKSHARH